MSFVRVVDALNEWIGRAVAWLVLAMVLIGAYNAMARYAGRWIGINLSSNAYLEMQWYLFSLVFLLGAAYALKGNDHVRVDVLYTRLPERAKLWIDLVGTVVLLVPFALFCIWASLPTVFNSWLIRETSPDPGGLPRYPIKAMILVAFGLLLLQGLAEIVRKAALLRTGSGADDAAQSGPKP